MQHYYFLDAIRLNFGLVTIGTFDGVHLGHQEIIHRLVTIARLKDLPSVVVTFYPHPAIILGKQKSAAVFNRPRGEGKIAGPDGDRPCSYPGFQYRDG